MVLVDFSTNCVLTVGEALMPPVARYVFAETLKNIGTFHRREASMHPLLCYLAFSKQQFSTVVTEVYEREVFL